MPFDPRVHVGVAGAIITPDRELLVIKRKGAHGEGTWALPGGWVDYDESPEQALARELEEEVNIAIATPALYLLEAIHTTFPEPIDTAVTLLYGTRYWSSGWLPTVMEPEKISDMDFVSARQLSTMDLFTPLAKMLTKSNSQLFNLIA